MKIKIIIFFLIVVSSVISLAQNENHLGNYILPKDDEPYLDVKYWIEDSIDADYHHPSAATKEVFRDIKYGVRIHWRLYSINEQGGESWPFLELSKEKKQEKQLAICIQADKKNEQEVIRYIC